MFIGGHQCVTERNPQDGRFWGEGGEEEEERGGRHLEEAHHLYMQWPVRDSMRGCMGVWELVTQIDISGFYCLIGDTPL